MDLDLVIKKIGQFGKYQRKVYFLLFFPFLHHSICSMTYVFTVGDLKYRCTIPECESSNATFQTPWVKSAIPHKNNEILNPCSRYKYIGQFNQDSCSEELFSTNETETCSNYVFETEEITVSKEFNLLCQENHWKRTIVGTVNNIGQFIGLPIAGYLSDRYGRKIMTTVGVLLSSALGILRSFSSSYNQFLIFELLDAVASAGVYCSIFILGIEIIGPDMRGFCGILIGTYYPAGEVLLGLIVWLINDWRIYLRVLYLPGFLFISYFWLLPESFRWYISRGKNKEAVRNLRQLAHGNGVEITEDIEKLFSSIENNMVKLEEAKESKYPLREVLSSKILVFRVLNCSYSWITHTLVFYGFSLNSVSIAGNKYLNFILVSLIEVPAYFMAWYAIDSIGRRLTIVLSLLLGGISSIAFIFVDPENEVLRILLFMTGKFAITISFTALYMISSEFFPTELRNSLLGFCSTLGRVGSMIAPQTPLLAPYIDPVLVFGIASFIAGGLALLFPETLNAKLPETIEEAEKIGQNCKK